MDRDSPEAVVNLCFFLREEVCKCKPLKVNVKFTFSCVSA